MKKTNKNLIVVMGVIILLAITFVYVLSKPQQIYQTEDKPEGVAFNYLFAMQHKEYERAYEYLSPDLDGYPKDVKAFIKDIRDYEGTFYGLGDSTTLEVGSVKTVGSHTDVDIIADTTFADAIGIGVDHVTEDIVITLQQNANGEWKIVKAQRYWFSCWSTPSICGIGSTPTPNAAKGTITMERPENPKSYKDSGELLSLPTYKKRELNELLGTAFSDPFYVCPNVWIVAAADQKFPTFELFFATSQEDEGKQFLVAVSPTSSEAEPYISADTSIVPIGADGKFFVTAGYQPINEQPKPGEYGIQLVFTGCEMYKGIVTWP